MQLRFFTFMVAVSFQYIVDTVCSQLIANQCNNKCALALFVIVHRALPPPYWRKIMFNVQTCDAVIQAMMVQGHQQRYTQKVTVQASKETYFNLENIFIMHYH